MDDFLIGHSDDDDDDCYPEDRDQNSSDCYPDSGFGKCYPDSPSGDQDLSGFGKFALDENSEDFSQGSPISTSEFDISS